MYAPAGPAPAHHSTCYLPSAFLATTGRPESGPTVQHRGHRPAHPYPTPLMASDMPRPWREAPWTAAEPTHNPRGPILIGRTERPREDPRESPSEPPGRTLCPLPDMRTMPTALGRGIIILRSNRQAGLIVARPAPESRPDDHSGRTQFQPSSKHTAGPTGTNHRRAPTKHTNCAGAGQGSSNQSPCSFISRPSHGTKTAGPRPQRVGADTTTVTQLTFFLISSFQPSSRVMILGLDEVIVAFCRGRRACRSTRLPSDTLSK